jgi:DNA-binding NarL/FixJ family response regulator
MYAAFLLRSTDAALQRTKDQVLALPDWELAGGATQWHEALERLPLLQPDALVTDLRLGDHSADRLLQALARRGLRVPTLVLVASNEDPLLLKALWQGALGYLAETGPRSNLGHALAALQQGRASLTPAQSRELLAQLGTPRLAVAAAARRELAIDAQAAGPWLSRAQQALLSLLAHGWLPREVGAVWQVAVEDVERRVAQLLRVLQQQQRMLQAA